MPRKNLDERWGGESRRLTVRLSSRESSALDELASAWQSEPSEALRRAIREAAAAVRDRRREALLTALPTMTVTELRAHAADFGIQGRSRMNKAELTDAVSYRLRPAAPGILD